MGNRDEKPKMDDTHTCFGRVKLYWKVTPVEMSFGYSFLLRSVLEVATVMETLSKECVTHNCRSEQKWGSSKVMNFQDPDLFPS
jgi:hypothetical protein